MRQTIFSPCRQYRYTLWREWDDCLWGLADDRPQAKQFLMVIGLNPSTADETKDDPTIRRCIDFAKRWGFGALCMTNLFAWRDTKPENMKKASDPIGPENDRWLCSIAHDCWAAGGIVLAGWGNHGSYLGRAETIAGLLNNIKCLAYNQDGSPMHPLYTPKTSIPLPWPAPK